MALFLKYQLTIFCKRLNNNNVHRFSFIFYINAPNKHVTFIPKLTGLMDKSSKFTSVIFRSEKEDWQEF